MKESAWHYAGETEGIEIPGLWTGPAKVWMMPVLKPDEVVVDEEPRGQG